MAKSVFKNASLWKSKVDGNSVCEATVHNKCYKTVLEDLLPVIRESGSNGCSILTPRCSHDMDCENVGSSATAQDGRSRSQPEPTKICSGGRCVPKCRTQFIDNRTAGFSDGIWCDPCHQRCVASVCQPKEPSKELYIQRADVNMARYAAQCTNDPVRPGHRCFESWNEGYLNLVRKATASVSVQFTLQANVCSKVFLSADISDFTYLRLDECTADGKIVFSEFTEGGEECSDLLTTWALPESKSPRKQQPNTNSKSSELSSHHSMYSCGSFLNEIPPSKVAVLDALATEYGFSRASDLFSDRFGAGTCTSPTTTTTGKVAFEATIKWYTDPTCSSDSTFLANCDAVADTLQLKTPACCFRTHEAVAESVDVPSDTSLFRTSLIPARDFLAKKCNINDHRDGGEICAAVHIPPPLATHRDVVDRWSFTVDPYVWTFGGLEFSVGSAVCKLFGLPRSVLAQVRMVGHSLDLVLKETENTLQFYAKRLHVAAAGNSGKGQLCTDVDLVVPRRRRRSRNQHVRSVPPPPPPSSRFKTNDDADDDFETQAIIHDDDGSPNVVCISRKSLLAGLPSLTTSTVSSTTTTPTTATVATPTPHEVPPPPPRTPNDRQQPHIPTTPKPSSNPEHHYLKTTPPKPVRAQTLPPGFHDPSQDKNTRHYSEGDHFWVGISDVGKTTIWVFFGIAFLIIAASMHYILTHRNRCLRCLKCWCAACTPRSVRRDDFFVANDDGGEGDFEGARQFIVENRAFEVPDYPPPYENDDDSDGGGGGGGDDGDSGDNSNTTSDEEETQGSKNSTEESGDSENSDDGGSGDGDGDDNSARWRAVNAFAQGSQEIEMDGQDMVLNC